MKRTATGPPTPKPAVSRDRNPIQPASSGSASKTVLREELDSEAARKEAIEKTRNAAQGNSTRENSKTY
ncbi:hypothetical protein [Herbaspirillum lusitanum]|uniref:hypothetical protein n=1 Tax=Herbaspirillum lusitanum TaxID=213312 RepID=UPI00138A137A|nr:hypothetical protein [Herbaspirillum lusitanum]